MEQHASLPEWASSRIEAVLGTFRTVRAHRSGIVRTGVWEIESEGQRFFFKTHNRRYKWGSEVHAYRTWGRAFAPCLAELICSAVTELCS